MAKLTNLQLDLLSNEIVDNLEKTLKDKVNSIKESDDYVNFEEKLAEQDQKFKSLYDLYQNYKSLRIDEKIIQEKKDAVNSKLKDLVMNMDPASRNNSKWRTGYQMYELYVDRKRDEVFDLPEYDREKLIRKIQAQILLGDVTYESLRDTKEIFNRMLEKFSKENLPSIND